MRRRYAFSFCPNPRDKTISHWYDKDGNPRHFEATGGKATTLREARKLNLYPSVTTVQSIVAAPQLRYWLQKQAVLETILGGWDFYECEKWDEDELDAFTCRVIAAAKEKTVTSKATEGTDIHAHLERFVLDNGEGEFPDYVHAVAEVIEIETGLPLTPEYWTAEKTFVSELGYGGTADLHNPFWVVDFKTKDKDAHTYKGWPNQSEQLQAYAHGFGFPDARVANIFIGREDGSVGFYEHNDDNAWNRFLKTLELWQVVKKYGKAYDELQQGEAA